MISSIKVHRFSNLSKLTCSFYLNHKDFIIFCLCCALKKIMNIRKVAPLLEITM